MCAFVIQETAAPPDNWHPLCYSPQRYTSQNGVHSDEEKRYSQSDMQIKHYLCSINKTLPKFPYRLSLPLMQAERACQQLAWGAPAVTHGLKAQHWGHLPCAISGKVLAQVLLQLFHPLSYSSSDKYRLREIEQEDATTTLLSSVYPNPHDTTTYLPSI